MEKSKHKDGMLAAGKKRLEQFRQKKQGKGNTSKHTKSETDLEHSGQGVGAEGGSSKGRKAKGSTRRSSSDVSEAENTRSDSGRNQISIDLEVVGAIDADAQSNAKRTPVESELSVDGVDSSSVTAAPDLSINMAESAVSNIDTNHSVASYDGRTAELIGERDVMNSSCSDHVEAVQVCDKELEIMICEESSAAVRINEPVALTAMLNTEAGDGLASELHVDAKPIQQANSRGQNFSEHTASSQDFSLQSASKEEEKETPSLRHELDSAAGMPQDGNTTSDIVEHMGVVTQVENKEQNLSSSCDAESATDNLFESKSKLEVVADMTDTTHIAASGTELHLSPISEAPAAAETIKFHCADIAVGLGSDECSTVEQPSTGEVIDTHSSREFTGSPSDLNLNQSGLCFHDDCGLKPLTDDICHDGMPIGVREEITSTARRDEGVTLLDASEPVDETVGVNFVKETATSGDSVDDSGSIKKDVVSVSASKDESDREASLVHTSDVGSISNFALDQTDFEGRSGSSGFPEGIKEGDTSREIGINAERTSAVEPDCGVMEAGHVEGIANLIEEAFSGNDFSGPGSVNILEAKQAITGGHQLWKAYSSSNDVGVGSAVTMEVEEVVTSDASHYTTQEAHLLGSDSGSELADSTMPASAKIEVESEAAMKPEAVDVSLDSGLAPSENSEEVQSTVEEVTNKGHDTSAAEILSQVKMNKVVEAFVPRQNSAEDGTVPVIKMEPSSELNTACLEQQEEARQSGNEVINTDLESSTTEVGSQLQMENVVSQNPLEGVTVPVTKVDPVPELNTEFSEQEEYARPAYFCNQELSSTKVLLDCEIKMDEPDIARSVVAVDNNFSDGIEDVGAALPGSGCTKHELDTFAVAAELRLSNPVDHRADSLLSGNASRKHEFENISPLVKDDLPLEMLSRADGHDHTSDLKSDSTNRSHPSLTSGLMLESYHADNESQVLISDGALNFGNDVKFIEESNEKGQESSEVFALGPAIQSCSNSKNEHESIILESCNKHEIVSQVCEYALPLAMSSDEILEGEAEHNLQKPHSQDLSRDVVPDAFQNETSGLSLGNTQEKHLLTGQLSRSFNKSDLPFESVQEYTGMEQGSSGLDESTLIEEAVFGNKIGFGASQHEEDKEFEEQSRLNNIGGSLSYGIEGEQEEENVIKELREALRMKESEMENYALLLNFQAAKNNEERAMAEEVLTHVVKRLANLVSQGSNVNEDGDLHKQYIKPFDVDNGGLEKADSMNLDHFLQDSNYWMDELQKELEGKMQTEFMRSQLEDMLLSKDSHIKVLTEQVNELTQSCYELQKDSEQMEDLKTKAMQWEELSTVKDTEIVRLSEKMSELSQSYNLAMEEMAKAAEERADLEGELKHFQGLYAEQESKSSQMEESLSMKEDDLRRLFDKVSELSQNYTLAMDEVAKAVEEKADLDGELKYFQKLYAEQESKASQMEELLSIKDSALERLFNKVAELSQNYDQAMSKVAESAEERLSLTGELNHYQRLSAEQEEERLRMCKQTNALADKISALLGPSSINVDAIHGDATIETLESLVASLEQHYETICKESKDLVLMANDTEAASQVQVNTLSALLSSKEVELAHLQEKVDSLTDELNKTRDDGERKVHEAEQKALGVRERLSLAVTKGKGLVQQRDNLKQLLAEKTSECETLTSSLNQELHSKTAALNEAENRAKLNSEAVERVDALESELSYIRNSANALRESFLQKDAVLQKIEELFEDANLSEELQIKDIYEKVEWLLESNTRKTSTSEGQNYSEPVATRDVNDLPVAEQGSQMVEIEHLNRKCDELLRKYRGMAEQSAMLEQSLLERNLLIQRWEEVLDAVDMPASVRLKESDEKIKWLGTTVADSHTSVAQFQAEIQSLQTINEALNNTSQKFQEENAMLLIELAAKKEELKTVALESNNSHNPPSERSEDGLPLPQAEVQLQGSEESELKQEVRQRPGFQIEDQETFVTNIRNSLSEIMQRDEVDNIFSAGLVSTAIETSVKLLVGNSKKWSTEATEAKGKSAELTLANTLAENDREKDLQSLHEALSLKTLELNDVTVQLEDFATKYSLLEDEVSTLQKTVKAKVEELSSVKDELGKSQLEASQLEDKLASTRQKLSMAVKKGKSVVEQRDALKQSLDEKTSELSQTRKELEAENLAFTNAKQSLKNHLQQMEILEEELLSSRNYASSLEKSVQESNRALQRCAEALDNISIPGPPRSGDLGEKIQWISQLVVDFQRKAGISEQEAKKSKKAAELLSLELEEVQGRLDSFAEELMHAEKNISLLIEEKKLAEASKAEAGLRLEHAMANVNSLLFELNESREKQVNLEQENNSLKDSLSAQMEEFRYKQAKADDQFKDLSNLHGKVYHLRANQSTFLGMVADQVFNSSEDMRETKNLVLRISQELKDQGFMSLLTAPLLVNNLLSKWQPEKIIQERKQGVTTGSLRLLCDEMETELQHFSSFVKMVVTASNQDAMVISQLLTEIWDGLGPLSQRMSSTESLILKKDEHTRVLEETLKAVTERLRYSIKEMEDVKEEARGQVSESGMSSPDLLEGRVPDTSYKNLQALSFSLVERFSSIAKDLARSHQEDDCQKERQNENLRNQLSKARAVIDAMDHQQQVDKLKHNELQKCLEELEIREDILKKTNQELSSLNDVLSAEKQEKGGLVQALSNAERKTGELLAKVEELEKAKQELEISLGKASSRFYTTVGNFNKFQSLSEKLIEEAESLHLLLEDRDAQILLFKEEVALKESEVNGLQNLVSEKTADLSQLYKRIGEIVSSDAGNSDFSRLERQNGSREELLEALATCVRAGTERLQVQLARKDALLQDVQLRHDDLARQVSMLESSLVENQRFVEERGQTSVIDRMMISAEAEDKGSRGKLVTPSVAVVTHGRGGRKVSAPSDHLALDVDTESSRLLADTNDEDKGHVFKPLTSSRLIPRGTRLVVDRLDGLWVSGERLLRRRPGARLSLMLYWLVLHVWMAVILL